MTIPPDDFAAGCAANARIKGYELQKHARLILCLIPGIWFFSSLARYEAKTDSWNCFQLAFWFFVIIAVTFSVLKQKRGYARDLAILAQLRNLYGEDISFENKTAESISQNPENSIEEIDRLDGLRQKGFGPLIGLVGALALVAFFYGLRVIIEALWPHLKWEATDYNLQIRGLCSPEAPFD